MTIAKGVVLPDYIIVSSRSHVTKKFKESRIVVGGIPAKCLALERECVWNYSDELNCDKLFGNQRFQLNSKLYQVLSGVRLNDFLH